jgi:beta-glucosidase
MFDVADTLQKLTIEEKAALCSGANFWHTVAIPRLGIGSIMVADGPHGLRVQLNAADHSGANTSLPATCFPAGVALGSSWDSDLVRAVGQALAEEASAQGISVILGPGVNIKRSPLCGRNFEYYAEDPVLAGVLATAYVQGVQSQGVGTSLKHFAVNNQETDRMRVSADVDERALREIYLPAFEQCVRQARPWTVMCAYNKVNGTYASESYWLLTQVLRKEWGFTGLVVSDWGAVRDRVASLSAGLDLEMPPDLERSPHALVAAVEAGRLAEAVLDEAASRVLDLVARSPRPAAQPTFDGFDVEAHHALARRAAAESAVLLKNSAAALPLCPSPGATFAVIGEFARTPRYQGLGSSRVKPTRLETFLDEFTARVGHEVAVRFAPGFALANDQPDNGLAEHAAHIAVGADCIILLLGLPSSAESEGFDRDGIDLPASQIALLRRLRGAAVPIVVLLSNGGVVDIASWHDDADAILECWLGGQAGASAAAQLLLGEAEPGGRLAETIPMRLADSPAFLNFPGEQGHVRYGEGIFVGYRYYDARSMDVAYPFGFGLSYTSFRYDDLTVNVCESGPASDLAVTVSCRVTNSGTRRGCEIVQLYVGQIAPEVARPPRELRAFAKLDLEPGASKVVEFGLGSRDFSYWSAATAGWVAPPGSYQVAVGSSSRHIHASATVKLRGASFGYRRLDDMATLDEWLADPRGRAALLRAVGTDACGQPNGIAGDAGRIRVVGNFPLRTLTVFPGTGLSHDVVDAMCSEVAEEGLGGQTGAR